MLRVTDIQLPCLECSLPCGILDVHPLLPRDRLDRVGEPGPHRIIRSPGSTGRARPEDEDSAPLGAMQFAQPEAFQAPCAKKFAPHGPNTGTSAKKLAQRGQKHRIWGVLSTQGEVFRAFALKQRRRANFFAPGTATTRNLNVQGHDDALTFPT